MKEDLFSDVQIRKQTSEEKACPNPCVGEYGFSKDRSKKCGECALLYGVQKSKVYYKCRLRKATNGPGSDHRVRWPACARFTEVAPRRGVQQ
jgi:hypothetical protein